MNEISSKKYAIAGGLVPPAAPFQHKKFTLSRQRIEDPWLADIKLLRGVTGHNIPTVFLAKRSGVTPKYQLLTKRGRAEGKNDVILYQGFNSCVNPFEILPEGQLLCLKQKSSESVSRMGSKYQIGVSHSTDGMLSSGEMQHRKSNMIDTTIKFPKLCSLISSNVANQLVEVDNKVDTLLSSEQHSKITHLEKQLETVTTERSLTTTSSPDTGPLDTNSQNVKFQPGTTRQLNYGHSAVLSQEVISYYYSERDQMLARRQKRVSLLVDKNKKLKDDDVSQSQHSGLDDLSTIRRKSSAGSYQSNRRKSGESELGLVGVDKKKRFQEAFGGYLTNKPTQAERSKTTVLSIEEYSLIKQDFLELDSLGVGRLSKERLCQPNSAIAGRLIDTTTFYKIDNDNTGYLTLNQLLKFWYSHIPYTEILSKIRQYESVKLPFEASKVPWIEKYPPQVLNEINEIFKKIDNGDKGYLDYDDFKGFLRGKHSSSLGENDCRAVFVEHSEKRLNGDMGIALGEFIELVKHAYPEISWPDNKSPKTTSSKSAERRNEILELAASRAVFSNPTDLEDFQKFCKGCGTSLISVELKGNPFTAIRLQQNSLVNESKNKSDRQPMNPPVPKWC